MGLSQISKTKSDSAVFKDLVRKKKNRRQKLTAESIAMQRSVKNRPLFFCIFCSFLVVTQSFFQIKSVRNGWNWFCCRVHELITTKQGILLRMNRSIQVEGAFGVIKQDFRFKRFLTRGKPKTETQFFLISFAYNVEKLFCFARSACAKPGFFCCILMNDIYFCTDSPHSFHTDILFDL